MARDFLHQHLRMVQGAHSSDAYVKKHPLIAKMRKILFLPLKIAGQAIEPVIFMSFPLGSSLIRLIDGSFMPIEGELGGSTGGNRRTPKSPWLTQSLLQL